MCSSKGAFKRGVPIQGGVSHDGGFTKRERKEFFPLLFFGGGVGMLLFFQFCKLDWKGAACLDLENLLEHFFLGRSFFCFLVWEKKSHRGKSS